MLRHRKNTSKTITELDLAAIDKATMAFHELWTSRFAKHMKSKGNTIKYHKFGKHLVDSIKRLGATKHYSAQFFESANRVDKVLYKGTSRRNTANAFQREMVQRGRTINAIELESTFDQDEVVKERQTAYKRAARDGEHAFPITTTRLAFGEEEGAGRDSWDRALQRQPELSQLPGALTRFLGCVSAETPKALSAVNTAVLNAAVPWLDEGEGELQTVRATPEFHKKEVFDCVRVSVQPRVRGGPDEEFAQLRLMFTLPGDDRKLAFVRWFIRTSQVDALTEAGCVSLRKTRDHSVIDLRCILRREYVVPDFKQRRANVNDRFHTCVWKWSRVPIGH
jgi:hypothetical protein